MPIFRPCRELLNEALSEVVYVRTIEDLVRILNKKFVSHEIKDKFELKIRKDGPGFDGRIGWYTHTVEHNKIVIGFLSEPFLKGSDTNE
jgi:hypothetical protein